MKSKKLLKAPEPLRKEPVSFLTRNSGSSSEAKIILKKFLSTDQEEEHVSYPASLHDLLIWRNLNANILAPRMHSVHVRVMVHPRARGSQTVEK